MPALINPPVLPSGRFGHQLVGGFIESDPAPMWAPFHGIPVGMQYFYGSVRSAEGDYWWPIRGFYPEKARYLHLSEAKAGGDFSFARDQSSSYGGPVEHGFRDGKWGVWTTEGEPMMLTWDDKMEWRDGEDLHITGELAGPATQITSPDAELPMAYSSRMFRSRGVIKGTEVEGFIYHDTIHVAAGVDFMQSPYIAEAQRAWVVFATEYEDGTVHGGELIHGKDGYNIMIVHRSDGPSFIAKDIDVTVEVDGDPASDTTYPTRVTYAGGGETWVWDALEGGRCPLRPDLHAGHRWRQGWVHAEGETRKPKHTEALMEVYMDRLVDTGVLKVAASR